MITFWFVDTHDFTLFVADKDKKCIYRMNSSAEVTDTYNFDSKVGSLTVDAYSSKPADRPSILYGINRRNNSGLMYRQNFAGSAPELIASFPGKTMMLVYLQTHIFHIVLSFHDEHVYFFNLSIFLSVMFISSYVQPCVSRRIPIGYVT